jgi:endonuclease I
VTAASAVLAICAVATPVAGQPATGPYDPPPGYYAGAEGLSGQALRAALHEVIDEHRRFPYDSTALDTYDILAIADEDPADPANVLTIYRNSSVPKDDHSQATGWAREHSWPKSYGFPDDISCNYPYSDAHHLFAVDWSYNSSRSNKPFDFCLDGCTGKPVDGHPSTPNRTNPDAWEVWQGRRGDIARALFYMDVRYEGGVNGGTGCQEPDLVLTDDRSLIQTSSTDADTAYMGVLGTLLIWHLQDPVDEPEQRRNEIIYSYQENRNPFVDHPEWVCRVWGRCSAVYLPHAARAAPVVAPSPAQAGIDKTGHERPHR